MSLPGRYRASQYLRRVRGWFPGRRIPLWLAVAITVWILSFGVGPGHWNLSAPGGASSRGE